MRMLQCQRLCDESAHRPSKYARMLETECIDHAGCIIGEPCDVERFPIVSRATDPAVVDEDQLVRRRETIDERRIPIGVRRGKSVQNKQPQAIPNATIGNLCTIDLDCSRWLTGHGRRQEITSRASKSILCEQQARWLQQYAARGRCRR